MSASPPLRLSYSASPSRTVYACLIVGSAEEPTRLEVARPADGTTRRVAVPDLQLSAQLAPLDDGRVLAVHHRQGGHQVDLIGTAGEVRRIVTRVGGAYRLLSAPASSELLAWAVVNGPAGCSLVPLDEDGERARLELAGAFLGGVWLDRAGRLLGGGLHRAEDGAGGADAVVVDLRSGLVETQLSVRPTTTDLLAAADPVTGLRVVTTDVGGRHRVGYGEAGAPLRFPDGLVADTGELRVLGTGSGQVLTAVDDGARSRLLIADTATDQVRELDLPLGTCVGPASLGDQRLIIPWSTPAAPPALVGVPWTAPGPQHPGGTSGAELVSFHGPGGPLEAIVLGDPARADRVVLALHGGPLDRWRAGFDPLLHGLHHDGAAVVALNQRGSTGYGVEHTRAVLGAWGGPDLDDVLAVAAELTRRRPPGARRPSLVGSSYGAWLALLAAARAPDRFEACVALAAFISPESLHAETAGPVHTMLERLGALTPPPDGPEVRDLVHRAADLTLPVQLVHGARDDVIPVAQARRLATALGRARPGHRLSYLEVPRGGHELTSSPDRAFVLDRVTRFLTAPSHRAAQPIDTAEGR